MASTINAQTTPFGAIITAGDDSGTLELQSSGVTKLTIASGGVSGVITQGTPQTTSSGQTFIDFTGIPSWAKRITVMFQGVSTSSSSALIMQVGTGSTPTYVTSGYLGSCTTGGTPSLMTIGFTVSNSHGSTDTMHGFATLQNFSGNNWVENSVLGRSDAAACRMGGGSISLAEPLTAIRITVVDGISTFDAGSINISYEG